MKTITWDEILDLNCRKYKMVTRFDGKHQRALTILANNILIRKLNSEFNASISFLLHRDNVVIHIFEDRHIGWDDTSSIAYGLDIYKYAEEPSVPYFQPSQCCNNPNIITNIVLDKSFKVCRNCKKEVI